MKDAIVVIDKARNEILFAYGENLKSIRLDDPKCQLHLTNLAKFYNIRTAETSKTDASTILKQIDETAEKVKKTKIEQETQAKIQSNLKTSTLYRSVKQGPLIIAEINMTLIPGQFIDLKSLGDKANCVEIQNCIRRGWLVKTTRHEINNVQQKIAKEEALKQETLPILDQKAEDFAEGGLPDSGETIDITSEITRASDKDLNDPKTSMSALMQTLDEQGLE